MAPDLQVKHIRRVHHGRAGVATERVNDKFMADNAGSTRGGSIVNSFTCDKLGLCFLRSPPNRSHDISISCARMAIGEIITKRHCMSFSELVSWFQKVVGRELKVAHFAEPF